MKLLLELPITIKDRELADMGLDYEIEDSVLTIRTEYIVAAHPNHDKEDNREVTSVFTIDGDNYSIYMPYRKFIKLWEDALKSD